MINAIGAIVSGAGHITTGIADMATAKKKAGMQEENNRSLLTSQILGQKAAKEAAKAKNQTILYVTLSIAGALVLILSIFLILKFRK